MNKIAILSVLLSSCFFFNVPPSKSVETVQKEQCAKTKKCGDTTQTSGD